VHISETTLSYLNGEFEVEPALGEKREEMLRMAGIKTFFIVKALKPVSTYVNAGIRRNNYTGCLKKRALQSYSKCY
jgi:adenylate cyclase 3